MLKIETYHDYEKMAQVWKLTVSDYELIELDFTPKERHILNECQKPEAPISMVALGLALLAKKIEQKAESAPNNTCSGLAVRACWSTCSFKITGIHETGCPAANR